MWNLRAKTPQQEQATVPWHQVRRCSLTSALAPPLCPMHSYLQCLRSLCGVGRSTGWQRQLDSRHP